MDGHLHLTGKSFYFYVGNAGIGHDLFDILTEGKILGQEGTVTLAFRIPTGIPITI
jgi:hypothetical protein